MRTSSCRHCFVLGSTRFSFKCTERAKLAQVLRRCLSVEGLSTVCDVGTGHARTRDVIVLDAMTPNPATADATSSIRAVMRKLFEMDVRHLPILDDGDLVGIVSDRDLREVTSRMLSKGDTDLSRVLSAPVEDIMSADVISVEPETELAEVADLMIEHRIGALPVLAPGTDRLVGIISYIDVLRAARDAL